MKQIRKRLTFANVVACLALFVALGGASYAATQLPKNSVGAKQIKKNAVNAKKLRKNAVNSSKVKNHSLKAVDFKAGQLPAGPQGEPGPLVETLPSGKTERGFYSFASTVAKPGGESAYTPAVGVSYPIPLSFSPDIHTIPIEGPSTSECPGTAEAPDAAPGNLCIYEGRNDGFELDPEKDSSDGKLGVSLFFQVPEGENYEFYGTWAVTAK